MTRWLVTGGSGFLGRHVLDAIEAEGFEPYALGRKPPRGWPSGRFVRADLEDPVDLACALEAVRPEVVLHAAGRTPPALPHDLFRVNVGGLARLIDALRDAGRPARLVVAGSAAELGPVPVERLPVDESCPCRPTDAYGLSKWAATRLALGAGSPLEVVVGRIFNPIGPDLPTSQAFGRFAALLALPGPDPLPLRVGDLAARRDFVDVRDAAAALVALALEGRAGSIYHVGTGHSRSVGEGLEALIRLCGRRVAVEAGGTGRGPSDSRADIARIVADTGWRPRIDFARSLADLWATASASAPSSRVA